MPRILEFFYKQNIFKSLASSIKDRVLESLFNSWDKIENHLNENIHLIDELSVDKLSDFKITITKTIDKTISLNEKLQNSSFVEHPHYKERYKSVLKSLNKTNNVIHFRLTKDNPVNKTSETIKTGVEKINIESLTKRLSV